MNPLAIFRRTPTPRQPGRHSAEWAAMVAGLTELQTELQAAKDRCRTFETACETYQADREETRLRHAAEIQGWDDALDQASGEYSALQGRCEALDREVESLRSLLDASDGRPCLHVDAPIEQGCRDTPQAAEATVQATLADLEQEGDKPLLDLLSGLKAAKPSSGPKPPMPGEITAATDVRTLWDRSIPVATPVSAITGERARESVADAVNA